MSADLVLLSPPLVFGGLVFVGVILLMAWALLMQKKALSGQGQALSQVDESLEIARRSIALQEQANELAREMLVNQQEILRLLQRSVGQPTHADQRIKFTP